MSATQITDQVSWDNCNLEISVISPWSVWTDISGESTQVEYDGGDTQIEATHTMAGKKALLTAGKDDEMTFTVHSLYTESITNATKIVKTAKDARASVKLRWSPKGGLTGQDQITTDAGLVESWTPPVGDANSAEALMTEWSIKTPGITTAVMA